MNNESEEAQEATALLSARKVFDIDAYGWSGADAMDPVYTGYAMWALSPPYDHDFDSWQDDRTPDHIPTEQQASLLELGHDFFGLMKTARHFIGQALVLQPTVPHLRVEPVPFDFAEFGALTALVAAADRLRDFLIVAVVGPKTEGNQLDVAYPLLHQHALGELAGPLRQAARAVNSQLREARHKVVHGLATQPARVQRRLTETERQAFDANGWRINRMEMRFEDITRHAQAEESRETQALEERVSRLTTSYIGLVSVGNLSFQIEYFWRQKQLSVS